MLDKQKIFDSFKNKNVFYGGYAALITLAVFVALLIFNLIMGQLNLSLDLTENKMFSLSEQSINITKNIEDEITIYPLYRFGKEPKNVMEILYKYKKSSKKIKVTQIDPELNPAFITKYDEQQKGIPEGSIIIDNNKVFKIIGGYDLYDFTVNKSGQRELDGIAIEQKITNAILYVKTGYSPKVYELSSHKEFSLEEFGLDILLSKENYKLETLNLLQSESVPEDASLLIITSPKIDITEHEAKKIRRYIENEGKCLFLFDFVSKKGLPIFNSLIKSYGISMSKGIVMEKDSAHLYSDQNPFLIIPNINDHEITKPLIENKIRPLIPQATGIEILDIRKRNLNIQPLLTTSKKSWIRTDLKEITTSKLRSDIKGPINIAVAISKDKTDIDQREGFRIVAISSSLLLGPIKPFGVLKGNIELFMNSLAWLNNKKDTISIRSKSLYRLPLSINPVQMFIFAGIFILLIPIIIMTIGVIIWIKRRHL